MAVVKLLLAGEDVLINSESNRGQTPLSWAAKGGHEAIVNLLLTRNDIHVNSNNEQSLTPLS